MSDKNVEQFHPHDPGIVLPAIPNALKALEDAFAKDGMSEAIGVMLVFDHFAERLERNEVRAAQGWIAEWRERRQGK